MAEGLSLYQMIPEQITPGLYCRTNSLFQDSKYAQCTSLLWYYCLLERLRVKILHDLLGWQYSYIGHLRSPQLMQRKFQVCCSVTNWRESHCAEIIHSEPQRASEKSSKPGIIQTTLNHIRSEIVKLCIYVYIYMYIETLLYIYFVIRRLPTPAILMSVAAVAPKA